ncbi:hypothetical protein ACFLWS_01400 [Chloroflexota bacterium]
MSETKCPICSNDLQDRPTPTESDPLLFSYDCRVCGRYRLHDYVKDDERFGDTNHLIGAWIVLQRKRGESIPLVRTTVDESGEDFFDSLHRMGLPQTVGEKLDALLIAYADIVKDEYGKVIKCMLYPHLIPEIAAKNQGEIFGLNELLEQLDYIKSNPTDRNTNFKITAKGWFRLSEINQPGYSSDSAFVALWYDPCTQDYRAAVEAAILKCGYKPLIIDQVEFNAFIMDEVVSLIRQSRFVVVDLTSKCEIDEPANPKVLQGARGGVYWESGMAFGMGKEVIQTCKRDDESKRRIHFDLDQYNTISWEDGELDTNIRDISATITNPTFAEKLAQRIVASVGYGSYKTE